MPALASDSNSPCLQDETVARERLLPSSRATFFTNKHRIFEGPKTMKSLKIARAFAAALLIAGSLLAAGCDKKDSDKGASTSAGGGDKPLTVGFIYVGTKTDYGYNQAHSEGAAALKAMGVKVLDEEKVAETMDVQKSMESMISLDGATVIFPTSFGYYDPHMLIMARKYPKLTFLHCG